MIINLNKFIDIKNFKLDFTNAIPGIYFLLWVDKNTQRWKKINSKYILHKDGNYVIDHGFDVHKTFPRILKYIGESSRPIRRLVEHYYTSKDSTAGIGPNFTHVRIISGLKRLNYDTIRLHHETLLVRKYLPDLNQASNFSDNYRLLLKNSNGLITPRDLIKPYVLHAREVFKAFKAWEIEDQNYLEKELIKPKIKNKAGLSHPNKRDTRQYRNKKGEKIRFRRWFYDAVLSLHKKQKEAVTEFRNRMRKYIRLFNPDLYQFILDRDRLSSKKTYKKNSEFIRKTKELVRRINKKQSELI